MEAIASPTTKRLPALPLSCLALLLALPAPWAAAQSESVAAIESEATRTKVKGTLRNGREIEYFPGEIVVQIDRMLSEEKRQELIRYLESSFNLSFIYMVRIHSHYGIKFKVLENQDVLQVMYRIIDDRHDGVIVAYPNGLGMKSVELPDHDFRYIPVDADAIAIAEKKGIPFSQYVYESNPFIKHGTLQVTDPPANKVKDYPYIDGEVLIVISHKDFERINYDEILSVISSEGGLLLASKKDNLQASYEVYFPGIEGLNAYEQKLSELRNWLTPLRKDNVFTKIFPQAWITPMGTQEESHP